MMGMGKTGERTGGRNVGVLRGRPKRGRTEGTARGIEAVPGGNTERTKHWHVGVATDRPALPDGQTGCEGHASGIVLRTGPVTPPSIPLVGGRPVHCCKPPPPAPPGKD